MSTKIIIQARTGSTRLPGKILHNFHKDNTILDILIESLKSKFDEKNIILATSLNESDAQLNNVAIKHNINFFRGNENDVLTRFIDAAQEFNAEQIVRICADNPFLLPEYISPLIEQLNHKEHLEYVSYQWQDQTPVMLSHIGLFAECFKLEFLKKISRLTNASLYREHVTNFLYPNKDKFNALFLPIPPVLNQHQNVRLTIDTKIDFETAQEVYSDWITYESKDLNTLLKVIQNKPLLLDKMQKEIDKNAK